MVSKDIMKTLYNPYNKDGSIDTSSFVHLKIQDNKNRQQLSSDQSLALLSNLDKTNYNIGFLNQNKEIAEQELSNIELNNKLDNMPDTIKKVSSDPAFWNAIYEYTDDTRKVNKVFENQLEYSKKNFLQKVYHDTLYQNKMHEVYELSGEINRVEREGGDTTELKNQRAALKMEAENMLHATEQSIASSAGSFASSMWQTKETIAAQAGIGLVTKGPIGAVIGGTVGAVGGYIQTKGIERNAMLDALEEVEGLTPQEKYDIADTYSTYSSVIEMAGWNLGVGKMTTGLAKGLRNLFVKEGKEGVSKLIKKMTTREGFLDVMKSVGTDVAISGSSEATEEVVQNEISDVVKKLDPQKIKDMGAKEHYELSKAIFQKTYDTASEIAKGIVFGDKMSDHAKEQLSTWLYTFAGSAVFGGPSAVVSTIGKANAHNNNIEAMEKAGIPEMLEGKENLRKTKEVKELIKSALNNKSPKAFDEIFKRIAEANGAEGKVIISADALSEAINNSENKDEIIGILKDNGVIDALNNAIDGKIELDYATAKNTIFSDELEDIYNQIIGDIAWDSKTMTPNEATTKFTNNITSKLSNVATEKVKELEDKLLTSMKGKGAKEKQLAHANAVMAWHAANALHNANPERSLEDYLNEVVSNLTIGDKGIDVDRVIQSTLRQGDESMQLVQKMNDIDRAEAEAGVPMWDKDTIEINGVERAVTNSAGERIAQSEKSLRMFYEWFGDSTVVDAKGRPLVVYHGTRQPNIREFKAKYDDKLIFFAYEKEFADNWATHAPLTPEQEEGYHNLYRDEDYENFRKDLNRKIKEKYGENWDKSEDSDFIDKILKEYSESKKEFINNKLGIKETTMPVYLKAESTFIPSEHWEWVIDEIEKYYDKDFRDENADDQTKSYMNQIKNGKWIFFEHKNVMDKIRKLGFDSIQLEEISGGGITTIAVFEGNNQIKSTSNRGTFSKASNDIFLQETSNIDNVIADTVADGKLHQEAYAGSRVDYDKPSLEAIGTGEGAQAHGWGLYYALSKEVAEAYRKKFIEEEQQLKMIELANDTGLSTWDALDFVLGKKSLKDVEDFVSQRIDFYNTQIEQIYKDKDYDTKTKKEMAESWEQMKENIISATEKLKDVFQNKDKYLSSLGQVHKVDIPENQYLLDEQKPFIEQSDFVQNAIMEVQDELQRVNKKEKIFDNILDEDAFFVEKLNEYEKKADGFVRFMPEEFTTEDGKYGVRYVDDYTVYTPIVGDSFYATGEKIYGSIVEQLGSKKAASKMLEKHGIKGITYEGGQDGRCFVIFNDKDVEVLDKFYSFVGRQSNLPPEVQDALDKAEQMKAKGVDNEEIRQETGWFVGPDGEWRFEISNKDDKVNENELAETAKRIEKQRKEKERNIKWARKNAKQEYKKGEISKEEYNELIKELEEEEEAIDNVVHVLNLGEVFESSVFDYYPSLKEVWVKFDPDLQEDEGITSIYGRGDYVIHLSKKLVTNKSYDLLKLILVHEIQHIIQDLEGFAMGGGISSFDSIMDEEKAFEMYERLYGEIEARNVSNRMNFSAEELRVTPITKTQDITDESKYIIKFNSTFSASKKGPVIAGSFDYKTLEIKLTSASNPTTFAHELMHYFMFNMVTYYNNGTMTEEWRKQFEKAMKWAGAEKDANGMYSFDASDPKVRAAQEKLAEGFTSYLLKGEAPSQSTRGLFSTFKTWFKAVYAMLRMKKVRLNQDVTRFYDKIFSVDGDVEMLITQEKLGMMEKPEGVSDEQWAAYQKAKEDAKDAANSEALKIIAKRTKLQSEQAYKDVFDKFFKEKLEELKEDPAYAARAEMLRVKVSKESVERVAGEGKLDKRFIATDKDIANPESEVIGEDIEVLANKFGFGENILEFIDWVNNADSEKVTAEEYARDMADAWIDENYPELREVSPEHALRNIAAMKVNIYEYMILNKIPFNQFNMIFNEMTKTVESMCATMSSKELANSEKLERRLKSVLDKIISLQNTNTTKGLASLKYRAAMLNYMIDISKAARNKRIRFAKKFNKYRKFPTNANLRNIDGQAWNLILDILYKYKMTSRHTASPDIEGRLQEFIEHVLDNGYSSIEDIKGYEDILINENGVSADTMPFGDFVILDGVLRDIEAAGKTLKKIVAKEESLALEDAENQIKDYADKNGIRARSSEDKGINKMKNWWMNGVSIMETQLSELMPTDLFKKYILPFFNGMNLAIEWKNNTSKRIMEIIKPVLQKQSRLIRVAGHQLTVLEGLVIMLNAGNKHNLKCMAQTLFEKKGIETDINQIIQELPSAIRGAGVEVDIRDVAQSVWDIFEETAPAMKEAQRQLNGREVNLIQATPITFADGKTIRGGYYPAKGTDYTGDVKNIKDTSNFIQKTFSFTLDRTGQVHGDLPLDLTMLTSWVGQIGKLMFVSNPANNIMKLTNSKLIESAWGDERIKSVKEWLALSISPEAIDPLIAKASSLGSVLILGGNIAKIFVQMLGFTAAIAYTGFHIIPSLIKCMTLVGWRSGYNNAKSKSAYIRNRYSDPLNHLYNAKSVENIFADAGSKGYDRAMKVFMSAVTLGDNFAATVVWDAVYNKSINEGMTEQDAILSADSAVRRTQGDTSHGSRPKAIQGWKRLLSPFCSYFLAVHNIVTAKMQHGDAKSKLEATIMLAMYGIVVPYVESILSSYVNYYGYSDEDKRKKRIKDIVSFRKDSQAENMITSSFNILLPVGGVASYPSAVALRAFDQQGFINPTVIPHEPIIKLTKVLLAIVDEAKGKDSADIMKEVEKLFGVDKILRSGRSIENIKDNLFN